MSMVNTLNDCARLISSSKKPDELREALLFTTQELGFGYFALTQHPNIDRSADRCIRLHNYAAEWQACYDRRNLGRADPVHRASHIWACGFPWSDLHNMIPFTDRDQAMLDEAETFDIGAGFTIPANVPGDLRGSVTFATRRGVPLPENTMLFVPALAGLAFQTARMIMQPQPRPQRLLTDHQLNIVRWIGCSKSNWEIGGILSLQEDTIKKHVRRLFAHYGVYKRTSLPLHALREGVLCLTDLFPES